MEKNLHLLMIWVELKGIAQLQKGGYLSLQSAIVDFLIPSAKQLL